MAEKSIPDTRDDFEELTSKLMHPPVTALNQAGDAERAELIALFQRIYKLPEPPGSEH